MRTLLIAILLLAGAGLIAAGCEHDLSKIAPAGDERDGGGSGSGGQSGSGGESGTGGSPDESGTGGESGGGGDISCEPGSSQPCLCPEGAEAEQHCQPDGSYGPCQCEPSAGGTGGDGQAGIGGRSGVGGIGGIGGEGGDGGVGPVGGSPGDGIICEADCIGDTAVELCMQYCNMFCDNLERFCDSSRCPARDIFCAADGTITQTCLSSCNDGDVSCTRAVCEFEKTFSCADYAQYCLNGDATCDMGGTCRDTCNTPYDMECDDGGEGSLYSTCAWGTDCSDCGPRYGDPPPCSAIGCDCASNGDCCGWHFGLTYCVDFGDGFRNCYATCTSPGSGECDPGFECVYVESTYICAPVA